MLPLVNLIARECHSMFRFAIESECRYHQKHVEKVEKQSVHIPPVLHTPDQQG